MAGKVVHVLWSAQSGPLFAYADPTKAYMHARTMLGVDVAQVELRTELPAIVLEDIQVEWDGDEDDETPRIVDIAVWEIDDEDK